MRVRLLGSVDVVDDRGDARPVPGQRRRSVLAALALRPGEPVSLDKLIDTVWDEPPGTPRNTIQAHVTALRRVLGGTEALAYRAPGYVLDVDHPGTDVAEARALADRARAADPDERIDLLTTARALWRGRSLADVAESSYLVRHREVLDDLRATLGEQLFTERLRRGEHRDVVAELEAEHLERPQRELLARLLMVALYRSGRQGDALAVHDRLVAVMRDELDTHPSATTRRTFVRIRDHDPALLVPAGAASRTTPAAPAREPAPRPAAAAGLVGRDAEIALARTLLGRARVVTIVGMGGVGKSTLASYLVAQARRDGTSAVSVDLTSVEAPRVPAAVAAALGVAVPDDAGPAEVVDALGAALSSRTVLVHLDNCEPVVDAVAALVGHVAGVAPSVTFLATSREPLHLLAEERLPLECLAVPDPDGTTPDRADQHAPALQLLVARAAAADPAWRLTSENLPALVEICRAVEGLPLGLEIIGSRLRSLTAGELAGELAERMLAWRHLGRTVDARHRSLGSLMDLSYGLLSPEEAAALDQLSTTRGAPLADAAALCHDDPVMGEELLLRLVDRSLVRRTERDGRSWVVLHEMVRTFAQDRLETGGGLAAARARHVRWVHDRVAEQAGRLHGPGEPDVLARLLAEQANLTAALDHAGEAGEVGRTDPALLGGLVRDLWWFWFRTGQSGDGLARVRAALEVLPPDAPTRPVVLAAGAYLAWVVDDYDTAEAWARSALDADPGTATAASALALGALARVVGERGLFAEAADVAARSAEAYARLGDRWGVAWSRRCRASALVHAGDLAGSAAACEQSRVDFEQLGDQWGVAGSWELLARIAERRGDPQETLRLGLRSLHAHQEAGDTSGERYTLQHLATAAWHLGDLAGARRWAESALELCDRHGYRVGSLLALDLLLDIADAERDTERRTALAGQVAVLHDLLGDAAQYPDSVARERRAARPVAAQSVAGSEPVGSSAGETR